MSLITSWQARLVLSAVLFTNRQGRWKAHRPWRDLPKKILFEAETQPELFDSDAAPPAYRPDPDQVRARLHKILAEARAAKSLPWDRDKLLVYRTIFPQMAGWLPEQEAQRLRFEFDTEMARLKAA